MKNTNKRLDALYASFVKAQNSVLEYDALLTNGLQPGAEPQYKTFAEFKQPQRPIDSDALFMEAVVGNVNLYDRASVSRALTQTDLSGASRAYVPAELKHEDALGKHHLFSLQYGAYTLQNLKDAHGIEFSREPEQLSLFAQTAKGEAQGCYNITRRTHGGPEELRNKLKGAYSLGYYQHDLTKWSINDVMLGQKQYGFRACGAGQWVDNTLKSVVHSQAAQDLGITPQSEFSVDTQQRLFCATIVSSNGALYKFITNQSDNITAAAKELRGLWRSWPDPETGKTKDDKYASVNQSHMTVEQEMNCLRDARQRYKSYTDPNSSEKLDHLDALMKAVVHRIPKLPQDATYTPDFKRIAQEHAQFKAECANFRNGGVRRALAQNRETQAQQAAAKGLNFSFGALDALAVAQYEFSPDPNAGPEFDTQAVARVEEANRPLASQPPAREPTAAEQAFLAASQSLASFPEADEPSIALAQPTAERSEARSALAEPATAEPVHITEIATKTQVIPQSYANSNRRSSSRRSSMSVARPTSRFRR